MTDAICTTITLDGIPCLNPAVLRGEAERLGLSISHWWGKPNTYINPRGRPHGHGWVLLTWGNAKALDTTVSHTLTMTCGGDYAISPLYILRRSILYTDGPTPSDNCACLVYLADERYAFPFADVNAIWASRLPRWAPVDLGNLGDGDTVATERPLYHQFFQKIWDSLPTTQSTPWNVQLPTAPVQNDNHPEILQFVGVSAWDAALRMLNYFGHEIAYCSSPDWGPRREGNRYYAINLQDTQESSIGAIGYSFPTHFPLGCTTINAESTKSRLIENNSEELLDNCVPGNIAVYFPTRRNDGIKPAPYVITLSTGYSSGVAGSVTMPVWDYASALYDHEGVLTNRSYLQDRATKIVACYAKRMKSARLVRRFSGLLPNAVPTGLIGTIIFGDNGDGHGMTTTELSEVIEPVVDKRTLNIGFDKYYPFKNGENLVLLGNELEYSFDGWLGEEASCPLSADEDLKVETLYQTDRVIIKARPSYALLDMSGLTEEGYAIPYRTSVRVTWVPFDGHFYMTDCFELMKHALAKQNDQPPPP